jgi:hypothetical protein
MAETIQRPVFDAVKFSDVFSVRLFTSDKLLFFGVDYLL